MMSNLSNLYKTAILDHNRNPRNHGKPPKWTHQAEGLNAMCGDQVNVYMSIVDEVIEQISFDGDSCAISMASASMMTEFLANKTVSEAKYFFKIFCQLMDKNNQIKHLEELKNLNVLITVKKFPSRIKSVTLCWHAMQAALDKIEFATTE